MSEKILNCTESTKKNNCVANFVEILADLFKNILKV